MYHSLSISISELRGIALRILVPIILAFAFIVGSNFYLSKVGFKPLLNCWGKCYEDYDEVYTRAVAANESGKRLVVFVGDSRIEWGVDPEKVQRVLESHGVEDVEVFNMALPGRNVRSIIEKLNEVEFYPDILVVGYSHLSFYWSKNYVEQTPRRLGWLESDLVRIRSFAQRKILIWPFAPESIWYSLHTGIPPSTESTSWLDATTITPRGQALVSYRLDEEEAVAFQKTFYEDMYNIVFSKDIVSEINAAFLHDISIQRERGAEVLLLKMPLASWATDLEKLNEKTGLAELAEYLRVPYVDGNTAPEASQLKTFDGLHLVPTSATAFSAWLTETSLMPRLR